jgi:hypothetical protein
MRGDTGLHHLATTAFFNILYPVWGALMTIQKNVLSGFKSQGTSIRIPERALQRAVTAFLRPLMDARVLLYQHVPTEGKRTASQGWNLKLQGMLPGMPDCDIHIVGGDRVFIELKAKNGSLNDNQIDCQALLRVMGFPVYTVLALTTTDAVAQVAEILRTHGVRIPPFNYNYGEKQHAT